MSPLSVFSQWDQAKGITRVCEIELVYIEAANYSRNSD